MIEDGTVSDPIEIGPSHSVLIRVAGHSPAHQLPLSQVGARVIAAIRADRTTRQQAAAADTLVAQVRAGQSLKTLAESRQLVTSDVPAVPRGAPVPDKVTSEAIFNVPPPSPGHVSAGRVVLADGRAVVFAVSRVIPGNPAEATAEQKAALKQQLVEMVGGNDVDGLVKALRARMRVTVADDRL